MANIFMHSVNWVRFHRQRSMLLLSGESDAASNLVITGSREFRTRNAMQYWGPALDQYRRT